MATPEELTSKFWKSLSSDRFLMIGLKHNADHFVPMTAQLEHEQGPIWFFTSTDSDLVKGLSRGGGAVATFSSKGHDLFAMLHGDLRLNNDPDVIDRLWNRYVAAWYDGGKADPKLALLRFDPSEAQIWLAETGLLAGIKLLLHVDPKKELRAEEAKVSLS